MSMSQKDLEIIAKKSNMSTDEVEKIFENAKNIWTKIANKIRNIIHDVQPTIQLLFKMQTDKELLHYSYMYEKVKTKRLKKKYKKKFEKRKNEIKELNIKHLIE